MVWVAPRRLVVGLTPRLGDFAPSGLPDNKIGGSSRYSGLTPRAIRSRPFGAHGKVTSLGSSSGLTPRAIRSRPFGAFRTDSSSGLAPRAIRSRPFGAFRTD